MVGYSAGHTAAASRSHGRVELWDLPVLLLLWIGAFAVRAPVGKWGAIGTGLALGFLMGVGLGSLRVRRAELPGAEVAEPREVGLLERWKAFMLRLGVFQSRLTMAFIYFVLLAPFALASRMGGDPLRAPSKEKASLWVSWEGENETRLEQARKQF